MLYIDDAQSDEPANVTNASETLKDVASKKLT